MSLATANLANGDGFIYKVSRGGSDILATWDNTASGVRDLLSDATISKNIGDGQKGVGSITVDSVDAAGNTITSITVGGVDQIRASFAYGAGLTVQQLATLITSEINSYTNTTFDYTAVQSDDTVYLYPNVSTPDASINGDAILVSDGGSSTYSYVAIAGASEAGTTGTWGYDYYLNASASASRTSLSGATDITEQVVARDFTGALPNASATIASGAIDPTRTSNVSFLFVDTESAASADDLDNIAGENWVNNDILFLIGTNSGRVVTVKHGTGNINLWNSLDFATADRAQLLTLYYRAGQWWELARSGSVVATDATINGNGSAASPLSVVSAPMVFTSLAADYGVTLDAVATSGAYSDLSGTPSAVDQFQMPLSFETNEQGDMKLTIYKACTINQIDVAAIKAIAGTDNGTIVFKDNSGSSMGTVTFTASDSIGTIQSLTPSTNNTFTAGQVLTATTNKTTAGGKMLAAIKYTVS